MLRKVNSTLASYWYTAKPLADKGMLGQAIQAMSISPSYEKRKQYLELTDRIRKKEGIIDVLQQAAKVGAGLD